LVQVHNEEELTKILPIAAKHGVPVTFRAAGTSLSGQAITDSVLLKLSHTGRNFRNFTIHVRTMLLLHACMHALLRPCARQCLTTEVQLVVAPSIM
jgi:FAD/FMN-containing dehydrogenase